MTKNSQENRAKRSPSTEQHNHTTGPRDAISVHSHALATLGGTTFTREDGVSLFTSMTKTLIEDIKSQVAGHKARPSIVTKRGHGRNDEDQPAQSGGATQAQYQVGCTYRNASESPHHESLKNFGPPTYRTEQPRISIRKRNTATIQHTRTNLHGQLLTKSHGYGTRQELHYQLSSTAHGHGRRFGTSTHISSNSTKTTLSTSPDFTHHKDNDNDNQGRQMNQYKETAPVPSGLLHSAH